MISIKDLNMRYRGVRPYALADISLDLPAGEIIGLFGENGAGKTTLMKCILGFLRYQGEITLDGKPITRDNIARLSFATSEHSFFPALSTEAHRQFYKEHFETFSDQRFDALMEFFRLSKRGKLESFSTGQKNQFEVILALSQGADYILLDEPFAGNDVFNREDFYKVLLGILEEHETILLSTHLIEEVADFVERAILLKEGKLIADISTLDLDEQGIDLLTYVKESHNYRSDRVSRALNRLRGEE